MHFDARVVEGAVEPPVALHRERDHRRHVALGRDVAASRDRSASGCDDLVNGFRRRLFIEVDHHDVGAGTRKEFGRRAADSRSRTGDDDRLTVQHRALRAFQHSRAKLPIRARLSAVSRKNGNKVQMWTMPSGSDTVTRPPARRMLSASLTVSSLSTSEALAVKNSGGRS